MQTVLLVEDREGLRQLYVDFLKSCGYAVKDTASAEAALAAVEKHAFSLILTDYMLPGMDGITFLKEVLTRHPDAPVIVMTAFGDVKLAVEAMRAGAYDFLEKPIDLDHLGLVVARALDHHQLKRVHHRQTEHEQPTIIGKAAALMSALDMVDKVAPTDANCLLLGESGVGKELFARTIHSRSKRSDGPVVTVNCAAIPSELIESTLFGHEKGAFTGAHERKTGLVEMANGGTLFLDEIGELPLPLQPKLLRVLQEQAFMRVGGNQTHQADVRLVCATNRDLKAGVRLGWFREDLYFRIAVFPLEIPPLRERREDLAALIAFFLTRRGHGHPQLSESLLRKLQTYDWPGNVRELENVLERAAILSGGEPLQAQHFPKDILGGADTVGVDFALDLTLSYKSNLARLSEQLEQQMIRMLLRDCDGHREETARRLGVSVKTLYNKMKAHHIEDQGF